MYSSLELKRGAIFPKKYRIHIIFLIRVSINSPELLRCSVFLKRFFLNNDIRGNNEKVSKFIIYIISNFEERVNFTSF